jgi:hypothetical protein
MDYLKKGTDLSERNQTLNSEGSRTVEIFCLTGVSCSADFLGQNNELLRNSLKDQSQKVIVRFIRVSPYRTKKK